MFLTIKDLPNGQIIKIYHKCEGDIRTAKIIKNNQFTVRLKVGFLFLGFFIPTSRSFAVLHDSFHFKHLGIINFGLYGF